MSQAKIKQCLVHDNRVGYVCLYKGCNTAFLCRTCFRGHPENHDSFLKEVYELQENPSWIQPYENERDLLVSQGKQVYSLKDQIISKSKTCLEEMLNQIAKDLEKQKNKLLEDLVSLINEEQSSGKNDLFSNLEENLKILQNCNFQDGDDFDKVINVKAFNEKVAPSIKSTAELIEKKFENCKLDQLKMDSCKEELIGFIKNIHIKNFSSSKAFQSIKDNDVLLALTKANEELTQSVEKLEKQVEELKEENNNLNHNLGNLKSGTEELMKLNNHLKTQLDELASENANLQIQNTELDNKTADLKEENKILRDQIKGSEARIDILQPEKEIAFSWGQKSEQISLSEHSMKAIKTDSSSYAGVMGSMEMSHGCYKWEIEVLCSSDDKNYLAFGVIDPKLIWNIESIYYQYLIGLRLNGIVDQGKILNKLSDYDGKIYLCHLDCDAGTFTISHAGTIVYRQDCDLRNKVLVPIVIMREKGSYAILRPLICVLLRANINGLHSI